MTEARYYVETSDDQGPFEFDSFDFAEEAANVAESILGSFPYAVAVDRVEGVWLAKFGDLPADWR